MKKLLVLALVLSIASLSSAALTLQIDKTTVNPGELVTVKVVQTAPTPSGSGGEMTISFAGNVDSVTDTTPSFAYPTDGYIWLFNGGISVVPGGVWFSKTPQAGGTTPGIGSVATMGTAYVSTVAFAFTATETTDLVWGGTWDGVNMSQLVGGTVTVIPEPMTLALLGLGGLFIRRKK